METSFVLDALEQALWATPHRHIPPAEAEKAYYASLGNKEPAA
ncbi:MULTISPECIES: hypothetical protein [unclassified Brenneria]|nr:hypothetical protein [Brenneria sp. hezel4-2-4]MEE3651278.1 hypothetical protein [Brenneria sp. HEZEL_4_2_4]